MGELVIRGGRRLHGEIQIHGAKNSALPIMAATLLCSGKTVIHNCPIISDVMCAKEILDYIGCKVSIGEQSVEIDVGSISCSKIPDKHMGKMRSSIIFLGALLAKCGSARLTFPGGCEIGSRPIDMHLNSLRKLGAEIDERFGTLDCRLKGRMKGSLINLPFPSVGATENIMLASVTAEGTTKIHNAAREPEIGDLAEFLNKCGAKVSGAGGNVITIEGVQKLTGCEYTIIPDRIEAATFMSAAAITGGDIVLKNVNPEHIEPVFFAFREAGCEFELSPKQLRITAPKRLSRIRLIRTLVYPGFPTDAQAPVMALCTVADGPSMFIETIFQNRYKHISEFLKLGASIKVEERVAVVEGVESLYGAEVTAKDLRGGAALAVAALKADGVTGISGVNHIDRGYQKIEKSLGCLGADIKRRE